MTDPRNATDARWQVQHHDGVWIDAPSRSAAYAARSDGTVKAVRRIARTADGPEPEAIAIIREMVRLADMGFEASLREPEENGNFAVYERAKRFLTHPVPDGPATAVSEADTALKAHYEAEITSLKLDIIEAVDREMAFREALKECAAEWRSPPTSLGHALEHVSAEFTRRMQVAADALGAQRARK